MFILNLVTSRPEIYLHEIQAAVEKSLLVYVNWSGASWTVGGHLED